MINGIGMTPCKIYLIQNLTWWRHLIVNSPANPKHQFFSSYTIDRTDICFPLHPPNRGPGKHCSAAICQLCLFSEQGNSKAETAFWSVFVPAMMRDFCV